jgi:2-keto-4-pentenoate hydratase/2-oxohepta-3-ene-1,7-dioic acid hydratase in catechol pathway
MSYRLLSYRRGAQPRAGLLIEGRVHDVAQLTADHSLTSVLAVLEAWDASAPRLAAAAERIKAGAETPASIALAEAELAPPVLWPGAIYAAGANYVDHVQEMSRAHGLGDESTLKEQGEQPWYCMKAGRSCVVGPGAKVVLPAFTEALDWELELAAVIGRAATRVSVDKALDCVAGYTVANDLSARDALRRKSMPFASPLSADWLSSKNFDGACPIGPWITPASDIGDDVQALGMKLWVGEELMQDSNTAGMIFTVAQQIASLSSRVTLQPGDLVLTGTPAGVGMPRKRFLQRGETVRLWIERIGEFSHQVV